MIEVGTVYGFRNCCGKMDCGRSDVIMDVDKNKRKRLSIVQKAGGIRSLIGSNVVESVSVWAYGCAFRQFCLVLKEARELVSLVKYPAEQRRLCPRSHSRLASFVEARD